MSNRSSLLWVPAGRGSGTGCRHGPPVVQLYASDLAAAAEGVAPGVGTAQAALEQSPTPTPSLYRGPHRNGVRVSCRRSRHRVLLARRSGP